MISCARSQKLSQNYINYKTIHIYYCSVKKSNHQTRKNKNNSENLLTICFSVYLFEVSKFTASIWPKSMSFPSKNMNSSLQTYFFFWYPSIILSPRSISVANKVQKKIKLFLIVHTNMKQHLWKINNFYEVFFIDNISKMN